jgi:hypothetical protein
MNQKPTDKPDTPSRGFGAQSSETELANARMGDNQLQGDDQANVRNERKAQAGVTLKTEGVIESFENMDPKTRAARENSAKNKG